MEYQDIVDENDEVVEVDSRDNIWKRGLEQQTRTVNAFVKTKSGKLVVPLRAMTRQNWPGCFDFSCGENVVSGESYDEAIARGLKEELGIDDLSNIKYLGKLTPKDGVFCFMKVYSLIVPDECKLTIDEHEFSDIKLFKIDEFQKLLKNKDKFKRGVVEVWEKFAPLLI
jgi:isopentenyl-diphosphate Delta-isomerase